MASVRVNVLLKSMSSASPNSSVIDGSNFLVAEADSLASVDERIQLVTVGRRAHAGPSWSTLCHLGNDGCTEHVV